MRVRLEDVCEKESSKLKQSDVIDQNGLYPVYGASGYLGNINTYQQSNYYIAVVKDGAGIGRTMLLPPESSIIGTMQYLIPKDNVLPEYLYYVVKAKHLEKYFSGATIPHIYFKDYKNEQFDLVSFEEQRVIINRLKKIEIIIDNLSKNLLLLDELVRARFVEMFGDPVTNDMLWNTDVLKDICTKIGSGSTPRGGKESYIDEGISLIRSMNVHNAYFEYKDLAHITLDQAEKLNNVVVEHDDLLFNITGASVARWCVVPSDVLPARVNQHVCILRCREKINPIFLQELLVNENCQGKLLQIAKSGATREAINKQQLESLEIMLPPLELQNQFASFVEEIDKSRSRIQKSLEASQELFDSLMQEYFG